MDGKHEKIVTKGKHFSTRGGTNYFHIIFFPSHNGCHNYFQNRQGDKVGQGYRDKRHL